MKVTSANDNQKETMIRFRPFLTDVSNLTVPTEPIDLAMLLETITNLPERKDSE